MLLFPFAVLYRIATDIRNHLFNIGHKKSFRFEVPTISVGNLNIGGSGKTPTIEYLIRLLKDKYQVATLSRGYGRRTRGLRFAKNDDSAVTLGDEPFQFYKNYAEEIKVVVGEDRAYAIPNIIQEYPDTSVILLDDAYQHRSVDPHFNILLTDFEKPFYKDFILPMGRLREARKEASRAHAIIVTKCKTELPDEKKKEIRDSITKYAGEKPIFFSSIHYATPKPFLLTDSKIPNKVVLVSGIARAKPFEDFAQSQFTVLRHFSYADHHLYTLNEIAAIKEFIKNQEDNVALLTTEKDMVRLLDPKYEPLLRDIPSFYLPIQMVFTENGSEFDALVLETIENAVTA